MILVFSIAAPYRVHQTQGVPAVMLLDTKENPTYGADLTH